MIWLCLEGKAETPIAVPQRAEAGNLYETLLEIPGSAVRGAFAAKYIGRHRWRGGVPEDEDGKQFEKWFENARVRFCPLRPIPTQTLLFRVGLAFQRDLDQGRLSEAFQQAFEKNKIPLAQNVTVCKKEESKWLITGGNDEETYLIRKDRDELGIYFEPFDATPVFPVPRSAHGCKYDDGIEAGHGAFDRLFFQASRRPPNEKMRNCPKCKAPLEPLDTPWIVANWEDALKGGLGKDYEPEIRLNTHVGIGPAVGEDANLSDEGRLFSLQHFPAGTTFRGWIAIGAREAFDPTALGFENGAMTLRVGRRSKSYGALTVSINCQPPQPPWESSHGSLEKRLEQFQTAEIRDIIKTVTDLGDDVEVFSLTCLTDLILLDDFLRPCRSITASQMAGWLKLEAESVRRVGVFTGTRLISGWNAAHRLPKENDSAIAAGSVFLFAVQKNDGLRQKLADLENEGIGWRRSEGFGQVLVCDPFHIQAPDESLGRPAVRLKAPSLESPIDLKASPHPVDAEVLKFFNQNRSLLLPNNQSVWSQTQINALRNRAQQYDSSPESAKSRLKQYLEHKADLDRTKTPLVKALIKLFDLEGELDWSNVRRRVDDFVRTLPVFGEYPNLKFDASEEESQ